MSDRTIGDAVRQYMVDEILEGAGPVERHYAARLPRYRVADRVRPMSERPLNANGKVDRRLLKERSAVV